MKPNMTPADYADENIRKKLRMLNLGKYILKTLLLTHDRIFFKASPLIMTELFALTHEGAMKKGPSSGGPHDRIFGLCPYDRLDNRSSYRENKRPSLQIVVGIGPDGYAYGDVDIDLASPTMDLIGFFMHIGEVLRRGPTIHKKLKKKIDKEYARWEKQRQKGRNA